jgi:hypothetical protein
MGTGYASALGAQIGQSTPATQALWAGMGARVRRAPKRRRARAAAPRRRKSAKRRASGTRRGKARLVKGSPAARRYMAKIRRMRKRK